MKKIPLLKKMMTRVSGLPWLKNTLDPFMPKEEKPLFHSNTDYELLNLTQDEFKILIHRIFKNRSYLIDTSINKDSVDLVLKNNNEISYVFYSEWRTKLIDVELVTKFHSKIEEDEVDQAIIITTGTFTVDAVDFARSQKILLVNGEDLSQMVEVLMNSNEEIKDEVIEKQLNIAEEMPELKPLCPICSLKMIKRTAKKGKNAGNTFWGCSAFPNCRGIISEKIPY